MGSLAKRVFIQMAMVLAILCLFTAFIVDTGSAEFYIVIFAGALNCCVVIIGLIIGLKVSDKQ